MEIRSRCNESVSISNRFSLVFGNNATSVGRSCATELIGKSEAFLRPLVKEANKRVTAFLYFESCYKHNDTLFYGLHNELVFIDVPVTRLLN